MGPHRLRFHTFIEIGQCQRQTRLAQPSRLGYPFVNLLKICFEDLRGKVVEEVLRKGSIVCAIALL